MIKDRLKRNDVSPRVVPASSLDGIGAIAKSAGPTIQSGLSLSEVEVDRENLRSEYVLLSRLSHPHWARPLGYFRFDKTDCFLAEVAKGEALSEIFDLEWTEAVRVCRAVVAALERLHSMGYVHLDLKPDHIFLDRKRGPKSVTLIDLGLALPIHSRCRRGTPAYSAPEALDGKLPTDGRSDLYSTGIVLWELLMARPLFPATNAAETLQHRFSGVPIPPIADTFVNPLRQLVAKLLAPEMDARPADAAQVLRQLDAFLPDSMPVDLGNTSAAQGVGRTGTAAGSAQAVTAFAPLLGRLETELAFDQFLDKRLEDTNESRRDFEYQLVGEWGVGCRRLARHLTARAAVRGWRCESCESKTLVATLHSPSPHGGSTVRLTVRSLMPGRRLADEEDLVRFDQTGVMHAFIDRLDHETCVRLAGLRVRSSQLADEIATLSLGSPTLLQSVLENVSPVHDLLSENQTSQWLESLDPPSEWVRWARLSLERLPDRTQKAVTELALVHVSARRDEPIPFEGENQPSPSGGAAEDLYRLVDRGVLEPSPLGFGSRLWAQAFVAAAPNLARNVARSLLQDRKVDGSFLNARLALLAENDEQIAIHAGSAIDDLLERKYHQLVLDIFEEAVRAMTEPGLLLEHIDWVEFLYIFKWLHYEIAPADVFTACEKWANQTDDVLGKEAVGILVEYHRHPPIDRGQAILPIEPTCSELFAPWLQIIAIRAFNVEDYELGVSDLARRAMYQLGKDRITMDCEWVDPGDPRIQFDSIDEMFHLSFAGNRSIGMADYTAARQYFEQARDRAEALHYPKVLEIAQQGLAAATYEVGPMSESVRSSWAVATTDGSPLQLINTAIAELNYGRLGMVVRCIDTLESMEIERQDYVEPVRSMTFWIRSRLGQVDDIRPDRSYESAACRRDHLDAMAFRSFFLGLTDEARSYAREVRDLEAPPDERCEFLADWLMLELDVRDLDGADDVYRDLAESPELPRRVRSKVQLAAMQFLLRRQLEGGTPENTDRLEQHLLFVRRELEALELGQLYWRSHHSLGLLYDQLNQRDLADRHWERAMGEVRHLLDSFDNRQHRSFYSALPGVRLFNREFLERK